MERRVSWWKSERGKVILAVGIKDVTPIVPVSAVGDEGTHGAASRAGTGTGGSVIDGREAVWAENSKGKEEGVFWTIGMEMCGVGDSEGLSLQTINTFRDELCALVSPLPTFIDETSVIV
ncbi:hypothetical protein PSPO01_10416 [Paraphaeosphaeria sporulosa]